jgi:hypothetical protein
LRGRRASHGYRGATVGTVVDAERDGVPEIALPAGSTLSIIEGVESAA